MPGYTGYHANKKNGWNATTIAVVATVHIVLVVGIYRIAQTEYVQDFIKVTKLLTVQEPVKPPDPQEKESEPEPARDSPAEPPPLVKELPPEPVGPVPDEDQSVAPDQEREAKDAGPADNAPFAIGKSGSRFSGYEGLLTASIQALYQPPADLSDNVEYAVLCQLVLDEDGYVLAYKLLNSSGDVMFDHSAQQALSRLRHVRPPPPGMSRTIVVKFFPP